MRGRLGSLQQLAIVTGIFVALLVDYLLAEPRAAARPPTCRGAARPGAGCSPRPRVPAVVYGVLALQIPESPRYLVGAAGLAEARDSAASA